MIKEVSYNTDELVISQLQMTLFKLRKYGLKDDADNFSPSYYLVLT